MSDYTIDQVISQQIEENATRHRVAYFYFQGIYGRKRFQDVKAVNLEIINKWGEKGLNEIKKQAVSGEFEGVHIRD